MLYEIRHRSHFDYAGRVRFARCNLRLKPIDWPGQQLLEHRLHISPEPSAQGERTSPYLANVTRITMAGAMDELTVESWSRIETDRPRPEPRADDPTVDQVRQLAGRHPDLSATGPANYLFASPLVALEREIGEWAAGTLAASRGIVEACAELTRQIHAGFRYDADATEVGTEVADVFEARVGVCQDFSHVMIAALRAAGLPAAYVSGYLRTYPPPGRPRLVGADATHAWVVVWTGPARGWIGFDPTNGVTVGNDHIVTAIGRDYGDVSPIDGVLIGRTGDKVDVSVDVVPVDED